MHWEAAKAPMPEMLRKASSGHDLMVAFVIASRHHTKDITCSMGGVEMRDTQQERQMDPTITHGLAAKICAWSAGLNDLPPPLWGPPA